LWCFNSESVARAIFALKTPVVAAIGHEIDVTIADFVADVRAPTPSAAAEIMVPNANDLLENVTATFRQLRNLMHYNLRQQNLQLRNTALQLVSPKTHIQQNWQRLDDNRRRLSTTAEQTLLKNSNRITNAHIRLQALGPSRRLALAQQQLNGLQQKLRARWQQNLEQHQSTLANLARMLEGVSPLPTLARGYAIVRTAKGEVVESTDALNVGDEVTAQLAKGAITANVINIGSATTVQSVDSGDDDESTP
jgi:exodeoxyribonuclease VII large subunit